MDVSCKADPFAWQALPPEIEARLEVVRRAKTEKMALKGLPNLSPEQLDEILPLGPGLKRRTYEKGKHPFRGRK